MQYGIDGATKVPQGGLVRDLIVTEKSNGYGGFANANSYLVEVPVMSNEWMIAAPARDMDGGIVRHTVEERLNNGGGFQGAAPTENNPITNGMDGDIVDTWAIGNEAAPVLMDVSSIME